MSKVLLLAAAALCNPTYHFQEPLRRPPVPVARDEGWVANPIDAFVLEKLEARGLSPAPPAGKVELARRAWFDLIGLPPGPEELEAFVADDSPGAHERLIDRLLASPHYGERWGRYWLDLVRYAESNGYERDGAKPEAWRYRDYVIRSFNEDKPYDQFIREQIAGDEQERPTFDSLIATGFYRLGSWDDEPDDKVTARFDELDDIIRTTSGAFLGLTVSCARCHDHKFDAIPQVDYYRFLSYFSGLKHADEIPLAPEEEVKAYRAAMAEADRKVKELEAVEKALGDGEKARREELKKEIAEFKKGRPARYPVAMGVTEEGPRPPPTHLLVRGNARQPGEEVQPGFLSLLTSVRSSAAGAARSTLPASIPAAPPEAAKTSGRRRALADWIADPANLLTARVMANRVWQFHLGRGIVRSASDFGVMGEPPTHRELLDWLAVELVEGGFRLKPLHKLIMTSSTYRMSSRNHPRAARVDPRNDLFSRFDLRRLEAEAIRDSVLAVSGRLNLAMGGPSVFPRVPPQVLHGQSKPGDGWGKSDPAQAARRSIYVFVKRSLPLPILEVFDAADTGQTCARRNSTTIAPQALTLLNGEFLNEEAAHLAERLLREAGPDPRRQVERAYRLALARPPSGAEAGAALALIERQRERIQGPEAARKALESFCLVVLNLNEFIYLD